MASAEDSSSETWELVREAKKEDITAPLLFVFKQNDKYDYKDTNAKIVIPAQYDFANFFREGLASVCIGGKHKVIDNYKVMEGGKWGFIDRTGKLVIKMLYENASFFENGRAKVYDKNNRKISIDKHGKKITKDS